MSVPSREKAFPWSATALTALFAADLIMGSMMERDQERLKEMQSYERIMHEAYLGMFRAPGGRAVSVERNENGSCCRLAFNYHYPLGNVKGVIREGGLIEAAMTPDAKATKDMDKGEIARAEASYRQDVQDFIEDKLCLNAELPNRSSGYDAFLKNQGRARRKQAPTFVCGR